MVWSKMAKAKKHFQKINKRILVLVLSLLTLSIFITIFFSYRVMQVPTGLTVDEAAFGYNATLLAKDGHDQNGRFLPFFVLSIDGKDWRQPVTQYYLAVFFKFFGASIFNLRLSSVLITITSSILLFFLSYRLFSSIKASFLSFFVFLTIPLIMIQSHMGLDNIMPIPFVIIWLIGLLLFTQNNKRKHLIYSAISLGISFYTYKGMRATVPICGIASIVYLLSLNFLPKFNFKKFFYDAFAFSISIFPFFAIIPILQQKYPGAVFDNMSVHLSSVYEFFYPYLSTFDPTFLFIKGDDTLYHSTQRHGMFLLATLPFFVIGCYQSVKKNNFWKLILIIFFTSTLFYGFVNSVHRASRIMAIIPSFSLLSTLGIITLWQYKKLLGKLSTLSIFVLIAINYFDFVKYYWYTYPKFTENIVGTFKYYPAYEILAKEAAKRNLMPLISQSIHDANGESGRFFEATYFPQTIKTYNDDNPSSPGTILLSRRQEIRSMTNLNLNLPDYFLQTR